MKKSNKFLAIALLCFCFNSCDDTYSQGKRIYTALCSNCHMEDGSGLNKLIPALKGSSYLSNNSQGLVCAIRNGFHADSLGLTLRYMPAHPKMTDVEMTNLVNYLSMRFGHQKHWQLGEVKSYLQQCQ